jgi:solute carrier family 25 protein 42
LVALHQLRIKMGDDTAEPKPRSLIRMLAGACAGGLAKTVVAPMDRVKIVYQVDAGRTFTLRAGFKTGQDIVLAEGVRGLWRGHGAELSRVIPHSAIAFLTFARYNEYIERATSSEGYHVKFVAGASAGATASILTYPLDLIRARLAVQTSYPNLFKGFKDILQAEGPRGLYHGLSPTIMGMVPYAGLSFATFETLKAQLLKVYGSDGDIPFQMRLAAGGVAGLVAQTGSYPFNVIRRRMQVQALQNASDMGFATGLSGYGRYRSVFGAIASIYKIEGLQNGLFKGITMTWIKGPLMTAISFAMNDIVNKELRVMNNSMSDLFTRPPPITYSERRQLHAAESLIAGGVAGFECLSSLLSTYQARTEPNIQHVRT